MDRVDADGIDIDSRGASWELDDTKRKRNVRTSTSTHKATGAGQDSYGLRTILTSPMLWV